MKKFILLLVVLAFGNSFYGQCVPDSQYASETFGFWPESSDDFETAVINIPYSQVINIKAPLNGGEIDAAYSAYDIDSITIAGISGLPVGYEYACNNMSCTIPGGEQACIEISGTTDTAGDYPLIINLSIYVNLAGTVLALPYNYADYTLTVQLTDGINTIDQNNASLEQNLPNPFSEFTKIPFTVKEPTEVLFQVFNMVGESVYIQSLRAKEGDNTIDFYAEDLNSGIYLYSITTNGYTQTKRMLLRK